MPDITEEELDALYRTLGLRPGTPLAEVESEYRFLAFMMHPDRLNPGPLQERAEKRLAEINHARERLKEHLKNQSTKGEAIAEPQPVSEPARHSGTNPQKADAPSRKYGPPPLPASALYRLFNAIERGPLPEPFAAIAVLLLIAVASAIVFPLSTSGSGIAVVAMLSVIWFIARFFESEMTVYRILKNPVMTGCGLEGEELTAQVIAVVERAARREQAAVETTKGGADQDSASAWLEIKLKRSGAFLFLDSTFETTLYLRAHRTRPGRSFVSYWFEVEKAGVWKAPLAVALKCTSEELRKALS